MLGLFGKANALHRNFCENKMTPEAAAFARDIQNLVAKSRQLK